MKKKYTLFNVIGGYIGIPFFFLMFILLDEANIFSLHDLFTNLLSRIDIWIFWILSVIFLGIFIMVAFFIIGWGINVLILKSIGKRR